MLKTLTLLRAPERNVSRTRTYHGSTPSVSSAAIAQYLRHMRRSLRALAFAVSLTVALSACALYDTAAKGGSDGSPSDAKITAEIRSQFNQHLELEPNAITVQTLDHVVYLHGVVSSGLEIDTADSIARQVPGVRRVETSIGVSN
jgi:osmotically-inducible protein OsmY